MESKLLLNDKALHEYFVKHKQATSQPQSDDTKPKETKTSKQDDEHQQAIHKEKENEAKTSSNVSNVKQENEEKQQIMHVMQKWRDCLEDAALGTLIIQQLYSIIGPQIYISSYKISRLAVLFGGIFCITVDIELINQAGSRKLINIIAKKIARNNQANADKKPKSKLKLWMHRTFKIHH